MRLSCYSAELVEFGHGVEFSCSVKIFIVHYGKSWGDFATLFGSTTSRLVLELLDHYSNANLAIAINYMHGIKRLRQTIRYPIKTESTTMVIILVPRLTSRLK